MNRPEFLTLEVTDLNNLGCGVSRHDVKVVFIKGAVTGDTVRAQIIKENKSFLVGKLSEIVTPSPYRVKSDECTAPLSCGGCVYRHITYEHEKAIKRDYVKNAFAKVLMVSPETIGDNDHFMFDLGGSSLDYFGVVGELGEKFGIKFMFEEEDFGYSVSAFEEIVRKHLE